MPGFYAAFVLLFQLASPESADLAELVRIALNQNPEIQAAGRRWEAAAARPSQVSSLPNPVVSFGYRNAGSPLPGTSVGENPMSFVEPMVMQRFPFPGKLGLRGEIAETEADRQGRYYDAVRLRIVGELKRRYFELYDVERSIEVLERSRQLLDRFVSIARSRYEIGTGLQQDVLRAQVEETLLEERSALLEREAGLLIARINQLLHRPAELPVRTVAALTLTPLEYSREQLYAIAEEANPILDARRLDIDRSARSLELARKEHLPDFEVKVGRMFMGRFDDMWEASIAAEIPLFFGRKESRGVEEGAALLNAARNEYEATGQALFREVADHVLAAETAERLGRLYRDAVIPQASLALESSLTAYRVGQLDFLSVLDHWSNLLDLEATYYTQIAEHEKALVGLEELTGLSLVGAGGAE